MKKKLLDPFLHLHQGLVSDLGFIEYGNFLKFTISLSICSPSSENERTKNLFTASHQKKMKPIIDKSNSEDGEMISILFIYCHSNSLLWIFYKKDLGDGSFSRESWLIESFRGSPLKINHRTLCSFPLQWSFCLPGLKWHAIIKYFFRKKKQIC